MKTSRRRGSDTINWKAIACFLLLAVILLVVGLWRIRAVQIQEKELFETEMTLPAADSAPAEIQEGQAYIYDKEKDEWIEVDVIVIEEEECFDCE